MYDTVLFPTDGSETALAAADHGIDMAARHDATMHVLYVVDHERVTQMAPDLGGDHVKDTLQEEGQRATSEIADMASAEGVDTTTSVREGTAGEMIISYAEDIDADAIVMGTNGRSGMDRLLLGSTAERVIQNTDLPVMTVKRPDA